MTPLSVFIVVIAVGAYGYRGEILPNDPKYRAAFDRQADCLAAARVLTTEIKLPALATLEAVTCRKLEVRK